jgi:hypothetical protein
MKNQIKKMQTSNETTIDRLKAELSQGKDEIARLRTIVGQEGGDKETGRVQAVVSEARQPSELYNRFKNMNKGSAKNKERLSGVEYPEVEHAGSSSSVGCGIYKHDPDDSFRV